MTQLAHTDMKILRQIESHARYIKTKTQPLLASVVSRSRAAALAPVAITPFPLPQSIGNNLTALGLSPTVAEKIDRVFCRAALRLKEHSEARTRDALQASANVDSTKLLNHERLNAMFCSAMSTKYLQAIHSWRAQIISKLSSRIREIHEARQQSQLAERENKRPFNPAAVPTLERFFGHTPRPSRAEKQQLAEQTKMEYKQINIWFQNRRNRSKKQVPASNPAEVPHINIPLPPDLEASLVRILEKYMAVAPTSPPHTNEPKCQDVSARSFHPFHSDRPQHAFPVCYPPLCPYDPFPVAAESRRFFTPWYRSARSSSVECVMSDAPDVLVRLEMLNIRDDGFESLSRPSFPQRQTWSVWFGTIPQPAPLPALLRSSRREQCVSKARRGRNWSCQRRPRCELDTTVSDLRVHQVDEPMTTRTLGTGRTPKEDSSTDACGRASAVPIRRLGPKRVRRRKNASRMVQSDGATAELHPLSPPSTAVLGSDGPPVLEPTLPFSPYPSRRTTRRKAAALPRRVPESGVSSAISIPKARDSSPSSRASSRVPSTPSPGTSPSPQLTLSRMSSLSSLRSVSSASSTSSDSDLLATPPMLSTFLHELPDASTFGLYSDGIGKTTGPGDLFDEGYLDYSITFSSSDVSTDTHLLERSSLEFDALSIICGGMMPLVPPTLIF
ncbi:uncharacterized protein C8Q71DRAFT_578057 [Rhodofomes roseus]|uniref:Homeobox domain-containing protein n=1 Tax=Rhodofomes roseus TaxID=34475 RepID=A0ABQ8KGF4_9APHY|nr:uncharacterized protein C8Q71DRAFT_578057 [Rhodofomes roseus]KAH9836931.1 hypothetical protein C8Q71DRAFT_578057 [Rhodofomes roseus]